MTKPDSNVDADSVLHRMPGLIYRCAAEAPRRLAYASRDPASLVDAQKTAGATALDTLIHPEDIATVRVAIDAAIAARTAYSLTYRLVCKPGAQECWVVDCGQPGFDADGHTTSIDGMLQPTESPLGQLDATADSAKGFEHELVEERARSIELMRIQRDVLQMVAMSEPLTEVLDALMRCIEKQAPEAIASILLLDRATNRLQAVAGPSLPAEFFALASDLEIGPQTSPCGTACYRREAVIVADIGADPEWANFRDPTLRFGLRACWSTPIFGASDEILGSFAIYFRTPRTPDDTHAQLVDIAVHIAAIAIERQRIGDALRESSARIAALVDSAMDAIITVDSAQHVILFNSSAEAMFGTDARQAIGEPLSRFIPARLRDRHDARFRQFSGDATRKTQTGLRDNVFGLRSNGEEFPIEASISRTSVNGVNIYTAIVRDITGRLRAERGMREALARFEAVIDGTPMVAIQGMSEDGRILHWNRASARLYGIEREHAMGRHFSELMDCGGATERIMSEIRQVWHSGTSLGPDEWQVRRLIDGRAYWLVSTLFPVFEDGQVSEVFCMDVDITDRKAAEARMLELNDELEERVRLRTAELQDANKELESFSYSVSHDLRAPLRGIDGFAQVLAEDYGNRLDETGHQHLSRIRNATQRMATLIDDLLMLAQISRSQLRCQSVDLSEIAARWLVHLAALEPTRKLEWTVEPDLYGQGDPALLELVLQNLLDNAWKFTGKRDAGADRVRAADDR